MELHTLIQVTCSYALLVQNIVGEHKFKIHPIFLHVRTTGKCQVFYANRNSKLITQVGIHNLHFESHHYLLCDTCTNMASLPYCFNMCVLILLHVDLNNFYVTKIIYVKSFHSVKFRVILLCVYWYYVCMAFSWHLLPASVTGYVYWSLINVCTEPHISETVLILWYQLCNTYDCVSCFMQYYLYDNKYLSSVMACLAFTTGKL